VKSSDTVVLVLTGHLLKDSDFTLKFHRGDLFPGTIHELEARSLERKQRPPFVLEARADEVVRTLQEAEQT
jgi:threonine synthase